jgi:DNA-binding MarR family transcriptional regulator
MKISGGRTVDAGDSGGSGNSGDSEGSGNSGGSGAERTLASGVAAGLERLIGLFRSLSPPDGLSLTSAATLATLERSGPRRLTALAAQEGVSQPAMTQLIARLQDSGLVGRDADPDDGRVVQVRLSEALAAALPAIDALTSAQRDGGLVAASSQAQAGQFT